MDKRDKVIILVCTFVALFWILNKALLKAEIRQSIKFCCGHTKLHSEADNTSLYVKVGGQRVYLFSAFWTKLEDGVNNTLYRKEYIGERVGKAEKLKPYTSHIAIIGMEQTELGDCPVKCCYLSENRKFSRPLLGKRTCCYANRTVYGNVQSWTAYYSCPSVELERLRGVSVAVNTSECPKHDREYIVPMINKPDKELMKGGKSIAVCVKVVFGDVNARNLVEWLEVHKHFGVDKVVGYQNNVSTQVKKVFQFYEKEGFLEIHPFDVPDKDFQPRSVGETTWQHWNDENVALLDCQERLKWYDFMATFDIDEFFVPANGSFKNSWKTFIRELLKRGKMKINLNIWDTSAPTVVGRETLFREPFKRGNTVIHLGRRKGETFDDRLFALNASCCEDKYIQEIDDPATNQFKDPTLAGIYVQWSLHLLNWSPTSEEHPLFIGRYSSRSTDTYAGNKMMYMPSRMVRGTGTTHTFLPAPGFTSLRIDETTARLHHYRKCREDWDDRRNKTETDFHKQCQDIQRVRDFQMESLGYEVAGKVMNVYEKLQL